MTAPTPQEQPDGHTKTGWEPGGERVKAAVRGLTRAEKSVVRDGYIRDCRMSTVRNLKHKGMFYHHIDSPNGHCGPMLLTPLGKNAHALLNALEEAHRAAKAFGQ